MNKIFFLLLVCLLFNSACKKFLTEESKSLISRADFYTTDDDAIAAVNAVYQAMRVDVVDFSTVYNQDWIADDGIIGNTTADARLDMEFLRYDSRHSDIRTTWFNAYRAIERANNVLYFATDSTRLKPETVRRVCAEARFLRAFYYFRLLRLFGGVPLMLEPADVGKNNLKPARSSEEEVYKVIISDLQYAEAHLNDTYAYNDSKNGGRATRKAAIAMLGKVYLTMAGYPTKDASKYQLAADKLKQLIDEKEKLGLDLNTTFSNIFSTVPTIKLADKERIFYTKGTSGLAPDVQAFTRMKHHYVQYSVAKAAADFKLYSFTAGINAYVNLEDGTPVPSVQADEAISGALPIGFNFNYGGLLVDKFYMCSNGFISFVPRTVSPLSIPNSKDPLIGPLLENLNGTGGAASYATTGEAPNRVLTVQWRNWRWKTGAVVANNISFQVKLYEADGKFEMLYDQMAPPVNGTSSSVAFRTSAFYSSIRNAATGNAFNWQESTSTYYYSVAGFQPGQVFTFAPNPRSVYEWADLRRLATVTGEFGIIKYNDPLNTAFADNADDFIWLRYSDVLLMYAEALAEIGGAANMDIALTQLNSIRRAHGGTTATNTPALNDLTYASQQELVKLVRTERRRELAFENHRWYDLKRWGILPATIIDHLSTQYGKPASDYNYINENMNYLPIPYADMLNNPNLVQNKGY